MLRDHSVRKPLHLCILALLERLLCVCDVEVIGRNDDVGDLRIRELCSGHTRTASAQRYNHTCSNDDWFVHDLLLGGSKGPEARGPEVPGYRESTPALAERSNPRRGITERPFERPGPAMAVFRPASALFFKNRSESATLYRILSTLRKGRRTRSPRLLARILILPSTRSSNLSWLLGLELVCNGAGLKADLRRRSHDATSNRSRFPRPQAGGPHRPLTARPISDQRFSRAVGGTDAPHGSRELELFNL